MKMLDKEISEINFLIQETTSHHDYSII